MHLTSEETRAVVRAMESNVEYVTLGSNLDEQSMYLDLEALVQYNGQGRCYKLLCSIRPQDIFEKEMMRNWAEKMRWVVANQDEKNIRIVRRVSLYSPFIWSHGVPKPVYDDSWKYTPPTIIK